MFREQKVIAHISTARMINKQGIVNSAIKLGVEICWYNFLKNARKKLKKIALQTPINTTPSRPTILMPGRKVARVKTRQLVSKVMMRNCIM